LLPPGTQFDLFRGTAAMKQDVDDMYPTNLSHTIKNELSAIELFIALIIVLFLNQDIGLKWLMSSTKGRIVRENPSSIPGWTNSWSSFTYLTAELRITRAPFL
ncbi:wd40 repeat-containing protein SMU1-like, partial [Trifolium medium]|nr:wd40 repeat-containing protein SMU1-like [Trifolium medium]